MKISENRANFRYKTNSGKSALYWFIGYDLFGFGKLRSLKITSFIQKWVVDLVCSLLFNVLFLGFSDNCVDAVQTRCMFWIKRTMCSFWKNSRSYGTGECY